MSESAPSAPSADVSFSTKLNLLWTTKKPLFIGLIVLITLIFFAIIFCVVYFLVIRPKQANQATTDKAVAKAAHTLYQSLRGFNHI